MNAYATKPQRPGVSPSSPVPKRRRTRRQRAIPLAGVERSTAPSPARHEPPTLQTKLEVGEPGDRYEQEADRVADQVLRMPDFAVLPRTPIPTLASPGRVQRACAECEEELTSRPAAIQRTCAGFEEGLSTRAAAIQRMCAECEDELQRQPIVEEEEEEGIQAKEAAGCTPEVTPRVQARVDGLRGKGRPLPQPVRDFFEPRFGHDFSNVRIHDDGIAADSARAVRARAFTVGQDVVFGAGQYAPGTTAGRRLLAHELTHVMQQDGGGLVEPPAERIQRQPLPDDRQPGKPPPLPPFELKFDFEKMRFVVCATFPPPVGRICSDSIQDGLEKACEIKPTLPWCGAPPAKGPNCSPMDKHFKPAKKGGSFDGLCCVKNLKESKETCCEKERMVFRGVFDVPGCCPPGHKAAADRRRCIKEKTVPPLPKPPCPADSEADLAFCVCPTDRMNLRRGKCCPEGQHASVYGECVPNKTAPPKTDKPGKQPARKIFPILFRIDRPQAWHPFADSVTSDGAATFNLLVARLKEDADLNVELSGHASSERPANDPEYNFRLTRRRVRVTAKELVEGEHVSASRVADAPGSPAQTCQRLGSGLRSCGDVGASPVPEAKDRNVVARLFKRGPSAE